jgi:hypothetical protein
MRALSYFFAVGKQFCHNVVYRWRKMDLCMWIPTKAEAVEMYARFWASRYGHSANVSAREMAASLKKKGDFEGHKVWNQVADAVDRLEQNKRRPTHQEKAAAAS